MADTSQTRIAYIEESTFGTTPATPTWETARFTSEGLSAGIDNITSNEIRADRNVSDVIQVGSSAGGNLDFELSYGTFDAFLESLMHSTWATNVLKNGATRKSFTIEKTYETGATDQFHRFTGAIANTLQLSMSTQSIVTGSFGFICKAATSSQAEIASSTYNAATTTDVINAATNFASLAITGVSSPELTDLELSITNNLTQQQVLGSIDSRGITTGRFEVTGSMTAYFESQELYEMFLDGTATGLTFELGGASSEKYEVNIPNLKFSEGQVVAGGNNQPLLVQLSFQGLYDSGEGATIKFTRTP